MSAVSILILEDKALLSQALAISLRRLGYVVFGQASSATQAMELLTQAQPDIALLDIDLGTDERNGIDVGRHIKNNYAFPFIFLTGKEDELTLERAKEVNPAAFLLKPASDRTLKSAIDIALANYQPPISAAPSPTQDDHLFVRHKGRFEKILQTDILWVQADESYSKIYTAAKTYTVTYKLKVMEERLNHPHLVRVHRSYIVNVKQVDAIEENMLLIAKQVIPVSKSYKDELERHFNIL